MIPTWKFVILKSLSLTIPRDYLLPVGNLTPFVNDHSLNSYIIHTCRLSFGMMPMMPQSLLTKYPDFWWVNLTSHFFFTMHWGSFSTRISTHILHHCWLHSREIYVLTGEIHKSTLEIPWKSRINPMSQLLMGQIRKNTISDGLNRWNPMKNPHFGWVLHRVKLWNPMKNPHLFLLKSHPKAPCWPPFRPQSRSTPVVARNPPRGTSRDPFRRPVSWLFSPKMVI